MEKKDFLEENDVAKMSKQEATVFAAKLISDAIDRYTILQKKNTEIQMRMAGMAGEMMEKMKESLDQADGGDEWKNGNKDEDENEDENDSLF